MCGWFVSCRRACLGLLFFFFALRRPPRRPPLFPSTPLFRSIAAISHDEAEWAPAGKAVAGVRARTEAEKSEEHTSELQSPYDLVCRLLLEKKKIKTTTTERIRTNQLHHTEPPMQVEPPALTQ